MNRIGKGGDAMNRDRWNWKKWVGGAAALAALVLFLLWTQGRFSSDRVAPGRSALPRPSTAGLKSVAVREEVGTLTAPWPGTVAAKTEAVLSAQIPARVVEIKVAPGDRIMKGALLIRLDRLEAEARLRQAEAGLAGAEARRGEAEADYGRMKSLIEKDAVSRQRFEAAESEYQRARAEEEAARQFAEGARVVLDFTSVTAPFDGRVVRKEINVGEFASPGRPLLALEATDLYRLEAAVPVAQGGAVRLGEKLEVEIAGFPRTQGVVEEIIPAADPQTRTLLIKVGLPSGMKVRSGMFGRLLLPQAGVKGLFIPRKAVREIGQLESVRVLEAGRVVVRQIRAGRIVGDEVEVLSGLRPNERVVLEEGS